MKLSLSLVLSAIALSAFPAYAHVGRGLSIPQAHDLPVEHLHSRGRAGQGLNARGTPQNAADMAKVSDPTQECKEYGLPSSDALSKKYPGSGIAHLVDGDDEAHKVWNEIQQANVIPNDVPTKGATKGHYGISDQASDSYDNDKDPDCWWTATGCMKPKHKDLGPDVKDCPEPNTWGLTFDDGPNCSHNAFYDYLNKQKLKATLFYIGTNVIDLPLQAQRGFADGHDICVHTWSHRYMTTLSNEQVFAELYYTVRIIKDVIGVTTRCWRPPFGDVDDRVRSIANALGLRTIIWSDDTDDWNIIPDGNAATAKIDSNYQKIIDKQTQNKLDGKGVVVLTHELTENTMNEFMKEFPKIKKAYQNVIPLTACLNVTQPYVEDNYTYAVFSDFIKGNIMPKGLPDMNNMPINVASQIDITPENKQTGPGGFSSKSKPASSQSSGSGSKSSGSGSGSKGSSPSDGSEDKSANSSNGQNSAVATRTTIMTIALPAVLAACAFIM